MKEKKGDLSKSRQKRSGETNAKMGNTALHIKDCIKCQSSCFRPLRIFQVPSSVLHLRTHCHVCKCDPRDGLVVFTVFVPSFFFLCWLDPPAQCRVVAVRVDIRAWSLEHGHNQNERGAARASRVSGGSKLNMHLPYEIPSQVVTQEKLIPIPPERPCKTCYSQQPKP